MKRLLLAVCLLSVPLVGCTGGGDDDGLPSDAEARGWSVTATYPNGTETRYNVTSDPSQSDTDGDGANDRVELQRTSDPRKIDTDEDRLLDGRTLCPDEGSDLREAILEHDIIQHPEREGCFLGETRTEIGDTTYRSSPTDAHSDSSPQLSDQLDDGTEMLGWEVELADGETYHVRSKPGLKSADTDSDGLHDGLEKRAGSDPTVEDTDGDGVNDPSDAAPLGNLKVTVHVRSINLKTDYRLDGGADLLVDASVGEASASRGPQAIQRGENRLDWSLELDVSDEGSGFTEAMGSSYAQGNWEKRIVLQFRHDGSGDGEPIEVRSSGDEHRHVLFLTYDAFEDRWTGHAEGGTSSGPDADVRVDLSSRIE